MLRAEALNPALQTRVPRRNQDTTAPQLKVAAVGRTPRNTFYLTTWHTLMRAHTLTYIELELKFYQKIPVFTNFTALLCFLFPSSVL